MLSRMTVSVLAFSSVLAFAPRAGAEAAGPFYANACAGPFNSDNITSIEPFKVVETNLKRSSTRLEGAVVTVAAQPGLTREWLQRQVDEASNTAQAGCPMGVDGASGRVTSTGDGFAITVSSPDRDSAKEILRRAESLTLQ